MSDNFELVECKTLGTNFLDIHLDGELWAREVPRDVAENFISKGLHLGNCRADVPKLRAWILELDYEREEKS